MNQGSIFVRVIRKPLNTIVAMPDTGARICSDNYHNGTACQ